MIALVEPGIVQTEGTYFLGFNAILNWDHLEVGTPPKKPEGDAAPAAASAAGSKATKK